MIDRLDRRQALGAVGVLLACGAKAQAAVGTGVLLLHGKTGSAQETGSRLLKSRLEDAGLLVVATDMPWSKRRYIDGDWDLAMQEMAGLAAELRKKGATRIVAMGHSMGVPAAMSHAARGGDVQALVLLAPGHVPRGYYDNPRFVSVRQSVDEARAMVAAGKGDEKAGFNDNNQGRTLSVRTTAKAYLSYFDPTGDAEMGNTAPRIPATVPVLTVLGSADNFTPAARRYYVDRLPANPLTRTIEVGGDHFSVPEAALPQVLEWILALDAGKS
ncbi:MULTISPECIES: alpha/beta hydrolase [Ramlibacter]|uniref:Alpha/beta fold hydrolase n=1 Tax=Ramlibacter pinisoli TaxID=2682844 RepID=A0A6N8IRF5_9BURK|nr:MULTISPECIES: alpha/beta hydrolase [Ramlibacter]MBA2963486.1 alpha/beta hydrolase [Ramlibacter sp. CGMCC 1.13660]MVQ28453.1 alpha/beta fold hydrolase [Ramlibacter pinisoli]